jgi:hypothetical protein
MLRKEERRTETAEYFLRGVEGYRIVDNKLSAQTVLT